ncbi:hypothetical protein AALP_AA5G024200 [Arabis alpina]|uniref:Zinc knuckle CX2CX4HX4C domain-containing protein n=1 Tax=Arabis alpina TaxID=50452 RepID=A0A087GUH2_ARAAL|nr:hypothetical protein AALP_AA5G024200 [Arabis alpina]
MEVTTTSAKVKVHVNGLKPLFTSSIVEYPNGDEVTAHLVYEKLERHCTLCMMLNHDITECPEKAPQPPAAPLGLSAREFTHDQPAAHKRSIHPPSGSAETPERSQGRSRYTHESRHRESLLSRGSSFQAREGRESADNRRYHSFRGYDNHRYNHTRNNSLRYVERSPRPSKTRPGKAERAKFRDSSEQLSNRDEGGENSRFNQDMASAADNPATPPPAEFQEAINEAADGIRDYMVQYSNCKDHEESVARKERFRQAELTGQVFDSAIQIFQASLPSQAGLRNGGLTEIHVEYEQGTSPQARTPASERLGVRVSEKVLPSGILVQWPALALPDKPSNATLTIGRGEPLNPELGQPSGVVIPLQSKGTERKKLGRPPAKRKVQCSPKKQKLIGASSRKRRAQLVQSSPRRRLVTDTTVEPVRTEMEDMEVGQNVFAQDGPPIKLIPKIRKRKMNFPLLSNPLP